MRRLTIRGTGLALGSFLGVSFVLCVAWGLVVPQSLHAAWLLEAILPGFRWLTPTSFVLGLVEAFLFGLYAALLFVPLFNYFEGGRPAEGPRPAEQPLPRGAIARP